MMRREKKKETEKWMMAAVRIKSRCNHPVRKMVAKAFYVSNVAVSWSSSHGHEDCVLRR